MNPNPNSTCTANSTLGNAIVHACTVHTEYIIIDKVMFYDSSYSANTNPNLKSQPTSNILSTLSTDHQSTPKFYATDMIFDNILAWLWGIIVILSYLMLSLP